MQVCLKCANLNFQVPYISFHHKNGLAVRVLLLLRLVIVIIIIIIVILLIIIILVVVVVLVVLLIIPDPHMAMATTKDAKYRN